MPHSNSDMIHRLQVALNANGYRILCNRSQFYSEQMKIPITKYTIAQSRLNEFTGKSQHVTLFEAYSTIQAVLFLRNLWYWVNEREIPPTNKMKGAAEFERKWNEFMSKNTLKTISQMKAEELSNNKNMNNSSDNGVEVISKEDAEAMNAEDIVYNKKD